MSDLENLLYKEKIVYKALDELDDILYQKKVKPFELNVVGGFALMAEQIRMSDYTDIDYIGSDLPENIKEIIDEIGLRYGLGRGWINNDILMSGNTLEDLELITGILEFNNAKIELKVITINTLSKECLLRMKIIAVDTSYSGTEFGGDFSRIKDFPDIKLLMEKCNINFNTMVNKTFDYIECPDIYFLIRYFLRTNDLSKFNNLEFCKKVINAKGKEQL